MSDKLAALRVCIERGKSTQNAPYPPDMKGQPVVLAPECAVGRGEILVQLDLPEPPAVHENQSPPGQVLPQLLGFGLQIDPVLHDADHAERIVAAKIQVVQTALVDPDLGPGLRRRLELETDRGLPSGLDQPRSLDHDFGAEIRFVADELVGSGAAACGIDALAVNPGPDDHALAGPKDLGGFVDRQKRPVRGSGIGVRRSGMAVVDIIGPAEREGPFPEGEGAAVGEPDPRGVVLGGQAPSGRPQESDHQNERNGPRQNPLYSFHDVVSFPGAREAAA